MSTGTTAAQRTFVELLARPLVTPTSDAELHRALAGSAEPIARAATRLGYRLWSVGRAYRLFRTPLAGTVAAPPPPLNQLGRRTMALICVLAAACEDSGSGTTLAKLSDAVAQITAATTSPVTAYEPGILTHRRQLLRAAKELEHWGVLRRRTVDDTLLEAWAGDGQGIGAGYDIDRDALLLLTNPENLALALDRTAPDPEQLSASRAMRALRTMVETPAAVYGQMDPADAEVLRQTRGLRSHEAVELTGGYVEARTEGLVLLLPDEPAATATVDWPRAATASWVSLLACDLAGRAGTRQADGTVVLTSEQADDVAEDLRTWRNDYLSKDLREDTARVRATAEEQLRFLGLLRTPPDGSWVLSSVAGRYRDPETVLATTSTTDISTTDQEHSA